MDPVSLFRSKEYGLQYRLTAGWREKTSFGSLTR